MFAVALCPVSVLLQERAALAAFDQLGYVLACFAERLPSRASVWNLGPTLSSPRLGGQDEDCIEEFPLAQTPVHSLYALMWSLGPWSPSQTGLLPSSSW